LAADNEQLTRAEFNRAFVLMQYFAFLKRDPDGPGFEFWLAVINRRSQSDAGAYRGMVCAFLSSNEYQYRFGMITTHSTAECGP